MASQEAQIASLRHYELRLLRCSLPPPSPPQSSYQPRDNDPTHPTLLIINDVVTSIEAGDYVGALSSAATRTAFKFPSLSSLEDSPDRFYSELLLERVESFLFADESGNEIDTRFKALLLMATAVAAFLVCTQCNVTGPFEKFPTLPIETFEGGDGGTGGAEWEGWARNQLMAAGSDLLGKFSNLQYIVFAKILLTKLKDLLSEGKLSSIDGIRSISWWLARLMLLQQRMLDERSSSLFDLLQVYTLETLQCFGTSEKVKSYWGTELQEGEAATIVSMLHLEAGMMDHTYGRVDSSRLHLESAELESGLQLSVTGSLGFRTVHQVEPKAQLLLVANPVTSNDVIDRPPVNPELHLNARHHHETSEASDVLMTPRFIEEDKCSENSPKGPGNGVIQAAPLEAIQQAVILAQCLYIEKSTPHDEMQRWEMAPYIEAVDSQLSSPFIISRFCNIFRIRWESTRSRTKERALMMMEKLVQDVYESSPGVVPRIYYCFGAYIPTIPALRKEYGELLVSCGFIGEAVQVFEDLELWDNLIFCYSLLEKKAAAVELIKMRLAEMPNDPRLWCSLGDVTSDDACYEQALEVSGNRSARAKRSLARNAYNRGEYEKSKILWEAAMALNALYPDGWFALGAAALKARDVEKAMDAFTSAVQLDPDNGEAWNNIACLYALSQFLKSDNYANITLRTCFFYIFLFFGSSPFPARRNSWQLWENFSHVAADVGNLSRALEATKMVLDITRNKIIDAQFLERMMLEIERRAPTSHSQLHVGTGDDKDTNYDKDTNETLSVNSYTGSANGSTDPEVVLVKTQETDLLVELLGKILRQVVQSGGGSEIWGLYGRWHKLKGDLSMCSEALLKQVRSYQGGSFSEMEEFRDLQACLEEVQMKLQASSACSA
ncbi:hypothetical protein RHSIM_Rhsim03G0265100 [Rhododendron simsii]|uniref:Uncharacterized protein n=1 Tax=Rhododendron simsii TaxID=118357 RepID=A0A834H9N2_RHOSS|nr:hypothetical protein RHSIM_Rhsim03G0265100 [Rhododendron simsii]